MKTLRFVLTTLGIGAGATFAFGGTATGGDSCCKADAAGCSEHDVAGTGDACAMHAKVAKATATSSMATATGGSTSSESSAAVVKAYIPIADALAADDADKAQHAAADLARVAKANGQKDIYTASLGLVHTSDLAAQRTAFKKLSAVVTPLVADNKGYVVMNCPMAQADWVQADSNVRNPYYGKSMLTCGAPKKGSK
jgi:hypothetical protein